MTSWPDAHWNSKFSRSAKSRNNPFAWRYVVNFSRISTCLVLVEVLLPASSILWCSPRKYGVWRLGIYHTGSCNSKSGGQTTYYAKAKKERTNRLRSNYRKSHQRVKQNMGRLADSPAKIHHHHCHTPHEWWTWTTLHPTYRSSGPPYHADMLPSPESPYHLWYRLLSGCHKSWQVSRSGWLGGVCRLNTSLNLSMN